MTKRKGRIALCAVMLAALLFVPGALAGDGPKTGDGDENYVVGNVNGFKVTVDGKLAYCYNYKSPYPNNTKYHPAEEFNGQENQDADVIKSLLLAGYPFDGFGFQAEYGISDDVAYYRTQEALWKLQREANGEVDAPSTGGGGQTGSGDGYIDAILAVARAKKLPEPGELRLADGDSVSLAYHEDGAVYQSDPTSVRGWLGTLEFALPDGVTAHLVTADGDGVTTIAPESTAKVSTMDTFVLRCTETAAKALEAAGTELKMEFAYRYQIPGNLWYYRPIDGEQIAERVPQTLFSFSAEKEGVTASFPITIDSESHPPVKPDPPVTPPPPSDHTTPTSPSDPTPSPTPVAPATPVIIEDEEVPLAGPQELVTIDDEEVPLSKEPQTGDGTELWLFAGIFALSLAGLGGLAAAALVRRRQRARD